MEVEWEPKAGEFAFMQHSGAVVLVERLLRGGRARVSIRGVGCTVYRFELGAPGSHEKNCFGKCGGIFFCDGCKKATGWCLGAADDMPNHCDSCVYDKLRNRKGKKGKARHEDLLRDT